MTDDITPAAPLEATDRLGVEGVLAAFGILQGLGHTGGLNFVFHCEVCHGPTAGTNARCDICLGHVANGWAWTEEATGWEIPDGQRCVRWLGEPDVRCALVVDHEGSHLDKHHDIRWLSPEVEAS